MKVTYFYSRDFESMPFVEALRRNNIETEAIQLPVSKFLIKQCLEKLVKCVCVPISESYVIIDTSTEITAIIHLKKILKLLKNGYMIRLRGDALIETDGFRNCLVDFNIKGSNSIFHVSNYLEQKYKLIYPSKRHYTVYNGISIDTSLNKISVDISKYLKSIEKHKIKILTVINFDIRDKIKYIKNLLPTIKRITQEHSALFVFIGDGKYLSEIKNIFYGQKGVLFLGRLQRNEVLKLMPYFDIFYYPSGLDTLGNAVLEASISALPVISTSVGGIPEIILDKKTGFLMKDVEQDSYRYLKLLIEDEELRYKISILGKDYVTKKFDWNTITNNFVKIVKSEGELQ